VLVAALVALVVGLPDLFGRRPGTELLAPHDAALDEHGPPAPDAGEAHR